MISFLTREWYTLAIIGAVVLASFLPISGEPAHLFSITTNIAIALLFFLHGAKLSRSVVFAGMIHWRLHLFVLATTFVLFPVLGLIVYLIPNLMPQTLMTGFLFLCVLPSTVQSSIAFTSIAKGNVPAAICSATASNILGMFLTPVLIGLLLHTKGEGGFSLSGLKAILLQLLLPFVIGQILQPYLQKTLLAHKLLTQIVDRGSILMVVYGAFSAAVINNIWGRLSFGDLSILVIIDCILLAAVLVFTFCVGGWLGFGRDDKITITFCGSKKSLASGVPMANVIFVGQDVGSIVLPLMIFHQIQLMVCAVLARRFAVWRQDSP